MVGSPNWGIRDIVRCLALRVFWWINGLWLEIYLEIWEPVASVWRPWFSVWHSSLRSWLWAAWIVCSPPLFGRQLGDLEAGSDWLSSFVGSASDVSTERPWCRILVTNPGRPLGRSAATAFWRIVTWLILPVVICLSQRLSHACLSISNYTAKLRMAH